MASTPTAQSRRQRRAARKDPSKLQSPSDVPMQMPDYDSKPTTKTLLEIADERRAELLKQMDAKYPSSSSSSRATTAAQDTLPHKDGDYEFPSTEPLGAFPTAVLYCMSLSMLHVMLDVLVLTQYSQEVIWSEIGGRMVRMTPALFMALWLLHSPRALALGTARQIFFFVLSISAGCYMLYAGNEHGYYFVMKRAPPLGTLWVWSVVEMDLIYAVVHLSVVLVWMWWKGYGNF
jgi:hypothetical protein